MRASGILMHVSSLPSPHGIGTLGKAAYGFVDFLCEAKQRYWQLLPMNPTGFGDSPYQGLSTFAGNPYFIDLDQLVEECLLTREEVEAYAWGDHPTSVDFGLLYENRLSLLHKAYGRFIQMPNRDFLQFVKREQDWLPDYALFMALKKRSGDRDWSEWDAPLRLRDPEALAELRPELKYEITFYYFLQYKFFEQWNRLRQYAQKRGVQLIGDVPIYVPHDSADVWANPALFQLDENREPVAVAGCPPDGFTADGQLWGNPLYDWDAMRADGYQWWLRRLRAAARMYDIVRIDHFRGFESYWAVPAGAQTARDGQWIKGPGLEFVEILKKELAGLRFIAEDLGYLTPEVIELQRQSGFPGMKVLEFAFDPREPSNYLPHNYDHACVCYTGTHDNATLAQWLDECDADTLEFTKNYLALTPEEGYTWGVIRGGMGCVADLFVAQMQDYLGLGAAARMNTPGTLGGQNWRWRLEKQQLTRELAGKIGTITQRYGRG